ncbi:hypothetical protein [Neisseria lactamica]|uniref:hypothetical protein n=1 Tax=Neisseria lactamica TaxID=486 RepID=UPI00186527DF|nr:hypothetical protein [Neisseria lactamica]
MNTMLSIIIALSFGGAATLAIWLLVEAADAVLRKKRDGKDDDAEIIERASRSANIRAAHAACPILGIGLWTQSRHFRINRKRIKT